MSQENYDPFMENIPAYALGALDGDEGSELRRHLETCPLCQAELTRYQQIGDGLMAALPPRSSSASVRRKLLARLNEQKAPIRPRIKWAFRQFAAGMVIAILLVTNAFALLQIRDLRQKQTQLANQLEKNHSILGMLASNTEVHPVSGDGFSGNLLLDRDNNLAQLLTWNLPPPPDGQVYQIWLIDPQGGETGAGLFRPETDRPFTSAALNTSRSFVEFVGIEVTIEPSGGSDMPTGQSILNVGY